MNPTAKEMVQAIRDALPDYSPDVVTLTIRQGLQLAEHDGVWIAVYSVPNSSSSLDKDNSRHQCRISITESSRVQPWSIGMPAPDKVKVEQFTRYGCPNMRGKTCSPEKAAQYIVDYFAANTSIFLTNQSMGTF